MNDTYLDEYTCAFQDTMICYRDDAARVRVPATAARLQLTDACRQVIKTGLYLIGLAAPERM